MLLVKIVLLNPLWVTLLLHQSPSLVHSKQQLGLVFKEVDTHVESWFTYSFNENCFRDIFTMSF